METKAFALFDFDGTLAKGDSIIPFMTYCVKKGFAPWHILPKGMLYGALYIFKLVKNDTWAKEKSMAFLKGKTFQETQEIAQSFYDDVLSKRLYKVGLNELARCRKAGMTILLISASPDAYLEPVRKALKAEAVLGTRCGLDMNQVYTGQFASPNCRGFEKTLRIAEYLASKGYDLDPKTSSAYGDSPSDWPMMALTAAPIAVNGKKGLLKQSPDMKQVHWA